MYFELPARESEQTPRPEPRADQGWTPDKGDDKGDEPTEDRQTIRDWAAF